MSEEKKRGGAHVAGKRQAPSSSRTKKRRGTAAAGGILIAVLVLAIVGFCGFTAYSVLMNSDIYAGVHMGECDLSGKDRAEARALLEAAYGGAQLEQVLDIQVGDGLFALTAQECGLAYDIPSSIDLAFAYGRQGGLLEQARMFWSTRFHPVQLELVTVLDSAVLETRVDEIAAAVEQPMAPSAYSCAEGVVTLDKGQTGYSLDREGLLELLDTRLRTADFSPVEGRLKESAPQPLSASAIAQSVNTEVVQTTLDLASDPTGGTVRAGTPGIHVEESALQAAINSPNRHETVSCTITQPDYTASEYQALLFRDVLGECTTDFNPGNKNRTTNVLLATDFCNGVLLMPGDVFSYNDVVGERTAARGFKEATIYVGNSAEDGLGGGVCQVTSTIYYAALRADVKIVEHWAHSREVTYVPKGEDATVAWGSKDFKFENNSGFPMKLVTSHTTNTLTVKLYGTNLNNKTVKIETTILSKTPFEVVYQVDESLAPGAQKVKSNGYTGYKTESYRVVYIDGTEVSRTLENTSTYRKYDKVILHNPATATVEPVSPTVPEPDPPPAPEPEPPAEPDTGNAGGLLTAD